MTTNGLPQTQFAALRTPFRVLSQLVTGRPSMATLSSEIRGQVAQLGRKFTKVEAIYAPLAPVPPLGWRYECGRCRFYQPETKTCEVVGLPGDPWGGQAIHPLSWCAWWLPVEGQPLLAWAAELVDPSLIPPGVTT